MIKNKIFYFMHIPWGWIKQRPHFLALELQKYFNVDIYMPKFYKEISYNTADNVKISYLYKFPYEEKSILIGEINLRLMKLQLKFLLKKYKYIWLTDIRLYPYIMDVINEDQYLIYDCMDDVIEFSNMESQKNFLKKIEEELFKRADLVLFSSKYLADKKTKEFSCKNYEIIYNALDKNMMQEKIYNDFDEFFFKYKNFKILTYIGTIAEWFDYDVIKASLEKYEDIVYFIVGPVEGKKYKHERVIYFDGLEHKYVKTFISKSDAMIMPFKVNELIKAVDPVKLYEYIAFNDQVISVYYEELDKFKPYIKTYKNIDEYLKVLKNIRKRNDEFINVNFILENSWEQRIKKLHKIIGLR